MLKLWNSFPLSIKLILPVALAVVLFLTASTVTNSWSEYRASSKVEKLEREINQAKETNLKLQGQVDLLTSQVKDLNQTIAQADAAVSAAVKDTSDAKIKYITVRSSGAVFNSPSDTGKVSELTDALNTIYPDSPNKP